MHARAMPGPKPAAEGGRGGRRAECVDHKASTSEIKNDLATLVEHIRPLREVRPLAAAQGPRAGEGTRRGGAGPGSRARGLQGD